MKLLYFALAVMLLAVGTPTWLAFEREHSAPPVRIDVDVWAGLTTPAVQPRQSIDDRRRHEAKTCLALNAYYEARGETFSGQVAVGQVALRRAGLAARHVCAEIYRPGQFSWTAERPQGSVLPAGEAWQWALAAAETSLAWAERGVGPDYSRGATFYHAVHVKPYWTRGLELVAVVGEHKFYR
jgi:N-acetylmuramoyl-L-alanine amidase